MNEEDKTGNNQINYEIVNTASGIIVDLSFKNYSPSLSVLLYTGTGKEIVIEALSQIDKHRAI